MIDQQKLTELYPHTRNKELASLFQVSEGEIFKYANKLGLKKTREFFVKVADNDNCKRYQFGKGHVPHNKGVKCYVTTDERKIKNIQSTQFKKGNVPPNHLPVGSERLTKEGYKERKTKEPNKWELVHRIVWQQHFGEIPNGFIVCFKDGNKENIVIDNLFLISRREHIMTRNGIHAMPKEIAELYQLKGAVNRQINKFKK